MVLSFLEALGSEVSMPFAFVYAFPGLETRVFTIYRFVLIMLCTLDFQFHLLTYSKDISSETSEMTVSPEGLGHQCWRLAQCLPGDLLSPTRVVKPPQKPGDGAISPSSFMRSAVFANFSSSSA